MLGLDPVLKQSCILYGRILFAYRDKWAERLLHNMVFFSRDEFKTASTQEWRIRYRNRQERGIESQKTSQPLGGLKI